MADEKEQAKADVAPEKVDVKDMKLTEQQLRMVSGGKGLGWGSGGGGGNPLPQGDPQNPDQVGQ